MSTGIAVTTLLIIYNHTSISYFITILLIIVIRLFVHDKLNNETTRRKGLARDRKIEWRGREIESLIEE